MLAVLNRSIVTDYTPALKPPWILLALLIAMLAVAAPRDLLPSVLVASSLSVVLGLFFDWLWERRRWRHGTAAEGEAPDPSKPAETSPER
jgi:hypothetical protein